MATFWSAIWTGIQGIHWFLGLINPWVTFVGFILGAIALIKTYEQVKAAKAAAISAQELAQAAKNAAIAAQKRMITFDISSGLNKVDEKLYAIQDDINTSNYKNALDKCIDVRLELERAMKSGVELNKEVELDIEKAAKALMALISDIYSATTGAANNAELYRAVVDLRVTTTGVCAALRGAEVKSDG